MNKDSTKSLGTSLEILFDKLGIERKVLQQRIISDWSNLVGDKINDVAKAERITDDVLFVRVKSMPWRTELSFQKISILKTIEDKLGKDLISDIKFY